MATGVIGGFTESVGSDARRYPDFYRETRDGPQLLCLHALFEFGGLQQERRDHLHTNPKERKTDRKGRVTCERCGGFIGYAR